MNPTTSTDSDPLARSRDVPVILEALQEAVRKALLMHKRAHNAVPVWRDEQVVWIAPEDIPVDDNGQWIVLPNSAGHP